MTVRQAKALCNLTKKDRTKVSKIQNTEKNTTFPNLLEMDKMNILSHTVTARSVAKNFSC
jgi:hypothetical protein